MLQSILHLPLRCLVAEALAEAAMCLSTKLLRVLRNQLLSFFHRLISLIFMSGTFAHNRSGPAE